ncbi:pantetheine-phosphate adenylyltransferase [Sporichthya brevicatena]|uniref:Phosphopantetheine adenylyltransferase n=1 Tax=Sporichthya brevicatena TaxID=171442 RepID=A0ABP3SDH7_9ACTN
MRSCICPGSFDPVTNGHLDVIKRAAKLADEVVVGVLVNRNKQGLFTLEERMELLRLALKDYPNVRIDSFDGLLVDYCKNHNIPAIVKGLRVVGDFDYEIQMAQMNHSLTDVETLLVATNPSFSFLSSSLVKEVANNGADITGFVPDVVVDPLLQRLAERRAEQGR